MGVEGRCSIRGVSENTRLIKFEIGATIRLNKNKKKNRKGEKRLLLQPKCSAVRRE